MRFAFTWLALLLLTQASAFAEIIIAPSDADRQIRVGVDFLEGGAQFFQSTQVGFGLFIDELDEDVPAGSAQGNAFASQDSNILTSPTVLSAVGSGLGDIRGETFARTTAFSNMVIEFEITSPKIFSLSGELASLGAPGTADSFSEVIFRGPNNTQVFQQEVVNGDGTFVGFDTSGTLSDIGDYRFEILANSFTEPATAQNAYDAFASWSVNLQIQEPTTVIPEPSSLATLTSLGLVGGVLFWRRRKKK
jgi:hypothetical protein